MDTLKVKLLASEAHTINGYKNLRTKIIQKLSVVLVSKMMTRVNRKMLQ
jgi:hypothetical protein